MEFIHVRRGEPGQLRCFLRCSKLLAKTPASPMKYMCFIVVLAMTITLTTGAPLPAVDLPVDCNSDEKCCMPTYTGKAARQFAYDSELPMRIRRPAHLVDKEYIAKLEKAYKILRALPDTDPRSLINQRKFHCLYCDDGLYFPGKKYPLEIHNGWFFLPWHRMFIYFHERILAKVLDDDTFALPYWNWDNQSPKKPYPNAIPEMYANSSSPLYDSIRNNCSQPPNIIDLNTIGGCTSKSDSYLRKQNTRLLYTQLVSGAPTTRLFYGMPYRYGDYGGGGSGTFEDLPHGTVHLWVGDPHPKAPRLAFDDMGRFGRSAIDPLFYSHHANIDRVWTIWETLPGGNRSHPADPDFLNTQFTYYDENADLVIVNVSQILDFKSLRYKYEKSPTPWTTNGLKTGKENTVPLCNPISGTAIRALIKCTKQHKSTQVLGSAPITFRVKRPQRSTNGTEVLEFHGIHIPNITLQVHLQAYLFFPTANIKADVTCPEFFATFNYVPHIGQATFNPKRVWRAALGPKLAAIGKDDVTDIVVTLVQSSSPIQEFSFKRPRILYDTSPLGD